MLSKLARQLGSVLLATSVVTAPVLGSMPRCSKTGALAGGGNCCCGERESATESAEPASCCAEKVRSCCQATETQAKAESDSVRSRCACKASAPLHAIPGGKQNGETREQLLTIAVVLEPGQVTALHAATHARQLGLAHQIPIPLRKIFCRWTV